MGILNSNAVGTASTLLNSVVPGAGLALSLGSQIFSAVKGSQANKASQNLLNKQIQDNESFYNNRVNRDFLETNAAKGIFEKLRKNSLEANKQIENKAAVTGGTAEAEIAAKSKVQENYNDAVGNLAQNATAYQASAENTYLGQKNNLANAQMKINDNKAENAATLAQNAGDLGMAAATLTGFEGLDREPILGRTQAQTDSLNAIANSAKAPTSLIQPKINVFNPKSLKVSPPNTYVPDYETPLNYR